MLACFTSVSEAMEIMVQDGKITEVREQAAPIAVKNAADEKVEAMPNPVTFYPVVDGFPLVTWETLASYAYDAPSMDEQRSLKIRVNKKKHPIPKFVTDLNGAKAAILGFLIPMDTDESGMFATSFVIVRTQMTCCFGVIPKLNEWVMVQMDKGKRIRAVMDVPTTVYGTLEVGEKYEDMKGWTLYRMNASKAEVRSDGL
jgi:hypothetical protein